MNAGRLIREICADLGGSAGGHGSMAGARLPLRGTRRSASAFKRELVRRFKEAFGVEGERGALAARPSKRPLAISRGTTTPATPVRPGGRERYLRRAPSP